MSMGWTPHPRWSRRSEPAFQPFQLTVRLQRTPTSSVELLMVWSPGAAAVLPRGGRFLFTAPSQSCSWADAMTGRTSISLGYEAYRNALEAESMSLIGTHRDEGENHYHLAQKA